MIDAKMPEPYTKAGWKDLTLGEINPVRLYATVEALAQAQRELEEAREALDKLTRIGNRIVLTVLDEDSPHANDLMWAVGNGIAVLAALSTPAPKERTFTEAQVREAIRHGANENDRNGCVSASAIDRIINEVAGGDRE